MSQAEYGSVDSDQIVIGPGGFIAPIAANKVLLGKIANTPPLESAALLKIAGLYKQHLTNVPLGNHFALVGLATRDKEFEEGAFTEYAMYYDANAVDEWGEDHVLFPPPDDPDAIAALKATRAKNLNDTGLTVQLAIRLVNVSGIGLFIESITLQSLSDRETGTAHFVIGVNPGFAFGTENPG